MNSHIVAGLVLVGLVLASAEDLSYSHGSPSYGHYGQSTFGNNLPYDNYHHGHEHSPKGSKVETYLKQEFHIPIPHPYPVHIQKNIPVPYPVEVKVPVDNPIPVHVIKPYPVHVEKPVPYPVHKNIPVPVKVPVHVPYPVKVAVPVEKPYPVHVTKNVPYLVKQPFLVEKHVPVYVKEHYQHNEDYSGFNGGYAQQNHGYESYHH